MGGRTGKPRANLTERPLGEIEKLREGAARLTHMKQSYEKKERTSFTWDEFLDIIEEELAKRPPEYAERLKHLPSP